ncbi:MAG: hypothetical protein IKL46_04890 [Clostridia bacterium]|nr:hypothetical protein [Clostridia bacterium]
MKQYEVIKRMSLREMVGVFFMFALPLINGEKDKALQTKLWNSIYEFLNKEVEDNGVTGSQTQPK